MEKEFLTAALPYANGPLHLGHLLELTCADAYARHRRAALARRGGSLLFVCADDQHGAAVALRARREGIAPEALVERLWRERVEELAAFGISLDIHHRTHAPECRELAELAHARLAAAGLLATREREQLYDPVEKCFLADRFVEGDCPRCAAPGQHGDHCAACGASYEARELGRPASRLSGATPTLKTGRSVLFELSREPVGAFCRAFALEGPALSPPSKAKLAEWLGAPLRDWDISRQEPNFGFPIPGEPGLLFHCWFDAPLGYYGAARAALEKLGRGGEFAELLDPDSSWRVTHFVGKDIVHFHGLFWPAICRFAGFKLPDEIRSHGFLTSRGRKLAKSEGKAATAADYLASGLDPELLRFYLFSKFDGGSGDVDISAADFRAKIDSELVGKWANLASRLWPFAAGPLGGVLPGLAEAHPLTGLAAELSPQIEQAFESWDFARARRLAFSLLEEANRQVENAAPWRLAREGGRGAELARAVHAGLSAFETATRWLAPAIPRSSARALACLNAPAEVDDPAAPIEAGRRIGAFEPLALRLPPGSAEALLG